MACVVPDENNVPLPVELGIFVVLLPLTELLVTGIGVDGGGPPEKLVSEAVLLSVTPCDDDWVVDELVEVVDADVPFWMVSDILDV